MLFVCEVCPINVIVDDILLGVMLLCVILLVCLVLNKSSFF